MMSKPERQTDAASRRSRDESTLNPAAASRRRLVRALGLGVAGSLAIDWTKPAIRLGSLPMHAQLSVPCSLLVLQITASAEGATAIGLVVFRDGSSTTDVTSGGSSATLEYTESGANETFTVALGYGVGGGSTNTVAAAVTCCTDAFQTQETYDLSSASSSLIELGPVSFDGDGDCMLESSPR